MKRMGARGTMAASCATFFALGLLTAALGPALPDLATRAQSSLAALGGMFTALFLGALLAQAIAGPLNDRLGQRPVLMAGLALLALGSLGFTASRSLALMLGCAVIAGLGHGAIDVSINVLIAEVFARRSAAAVNLVNVFFGVGAVAGPALASLTLRVWATALPALWIGAGMLLLLLPIVPLLAGTPTVPQSSNDAPRGLALFRSPLLWALGALNLLYVGSEIGMGGWTTTYLERSTTLDAGTAALVTSGFWLALTGGRVFAAVLGTRLAANALLLISLGGAFVGGGLLVLSAGNAILTTAAVLILGLCFGPIFPTTLAIVTASFRGAPGTAASIVVAAGSIGGMLLPWLQGVLLEQSGPPASALLVAGGTLAMLALQLGRGMLAGRRPTTDDRQPTSAGVIDACIES